MIETSEGTSHDKGDFMHARAKSLLRSVFAFLSGRDIQLAAWDDVRDKLKPQGLVSRGMQTVAVDKIVGSVGRYRDFDDAFLPRSQHLTDRWIRINRAWNTDVVLPPVKLYMVGEVYFVIDGNHRISVAREHGVEFVDAEVIEAVLRVPVTERDIDARNLVVLGEYAAFLERTGLDRLRPDASVRFSIAGAYDHVLEHIEKHGYYMGLEQKRAVPYSEMVSDWYDHVYLPLVDVIRQEDIVREFPGRTEADLYLWVIEHRFYLQEAAGEQDVPIGVAALDYAQHYAPRSALQRMQQAVGNLVDAVLD